jgi:hypothetical protein
MFSNQRDFPEGREVAPLAADEFTVRVGGLRLPEAPLELSAANLFLLSRASIVPVGLTIFREREVEPATARVKGSTTGCAGTLRRWVKHNTLASKYTYLWSVHTGQEGYADPRRDRHTQKLVFVLLIISKTIKHQTAFKLFCFLRGFFQKKKEEKTLYKNHNSL